MRGIKMDPEDPDGYIAKFEVMVRHAGYNINDPLTIGHYTKGLPIGLYETVKARRAFCQSTSWRGIP